jgi:hypothetical protein
MDQRLGRGGDKGSNAIAGLFTDDAYYHRGPFVNRIVDATRFAHIGSRPCPDKSTRESGSAAIESAGRAAVEFWCVLRHPRRANTDRIRLRHVRFDRTDAARSCTVLARRVERGNRSGRGLVLAARRGQSA